ncbi:MAG: hypothetical protein K2F81_05690 [Ruminococcus sp.]|nr:hypothetical protein [Ruminococcus sp.]
MKIKETLTTLVCLLTICVVGVGCSNKESLSDYEKVPLSASWSYNYESIDELTKFSDIIAVISVDGMNLDKTYESYGVTLTKYSAEIKELIYGEEGSKIDIIMTGGIDNVEKKIYEVVDDPLMEKGDEYLIFAQKNEDGTYAVLSGSQGRFVFKNDRVYSLNVINEQVSTNNIYSNIKVDGDKKEDFIMQISASLDKYEKRSPSSKY